MLTFLVSVFCDGEGDIDVEIRADAVLDLAGNGNEMASTSITLDDTPLTIEITSPESINDLTTTFEVSVEFGKEITGFTLDDVTVANGEASNLSSDDNINFTLDIFPNGGGNITIDISAGVVEDLLGNANEAAEQATVGFVLSSIDGLSQEVSLYPNPTSGMVSIEGIDYSEVRVLTATGKKINVQIGQSALDFTNVEAGIYWIELKTHSGKLTRRIVKK